MVTGMTLATYDEEGEALQYLNLVLKVRSAPSFLFLKRLKVTNNEPVGKALTAEH